MSVPLNLNVSWKSINKIERKLPWAVYSGKPQDEILGFSESKKELHISQADLFIRQKLSSYDIRVTISLSWASNCH